MGKSLSIAAITISIYDVNGYSIEPGHPIDDDYPLHPSLEKLRSKLVYRQSPLLTPSEIKQINSRQLAMYESEPMVSRKILMIQEEIKAAAKSFDDAFSNSYTQKDGQSKSHFINFMVHGNSGKPQEVDVTTLKGDNKNFYSYLLDGNVEQAKAISAEVFFDCENAWTAKLIELSYKVFFTDEQIGNLQRKFKDDADRKKQAGVWFNALKEIIFEAGGRGSRFNSFTESRRFDDDLPRNVGRNRRLTSYQYTLAFITKNIMTSVPADGPSYYALRYMWSAMNLDIGKHFKQVTRGETDFNQIRCRWFYQFGFVTYDQSFISGYRWKLGDDRDTFEKFIIILMDIQNWHDKEYKLKEDSFKVPYLNDIGFKAQYLAKVLGEGDYQLDNDYFGVSANNIGEGETPFLKAIQTVLVSWYNAIQTPDKKLLSIIRTKLSRQLMENCFEYWCSGSGESRKFNQGVLDYFYKE